MKILALASCFLCFIAIAQTRPAWEEFMDSIKGMDDSWSDVPEETAIDFGNGDILSVLQQEFSDPGKKKKNKKKAKEEEEGKEKSPEDMTPAERRAARREQEKEYADDDGDYLGHDCLNIKNYTKENWDDEIWNRGVVKRPFTQPTGKMKKQPDRLYVKYTSAYGIPMIGTAKFSDDSMKRGCYLIRYIFAGNQHLRIAARRSGFINLGYNGGVCCPAQMGNNGLSCPCDGKFPQLGKGAPAHEMAHYYIKYLLTPMVWDGRFKLPEYIDPYKTGWEYKDTPYAVEGVKCSFGNIKGLLKTYGDFYTWVWNSQRQDRIRRTTICPCKMHHYMIYSGQEKWLFHGNERTMEQGRACFKIRSPNLYNLLERIWPCKNTH